VKLIREGEIQAATMDTIRRALGAFRQSPMALIELEDTLEEIATRSWEENLSSLLKKDEKIEADPKRAFVLGMKLGGRIAYQATLRNVERSLDQWASECLQVGTGAESPEGGDPEDA